MTRSNHPDLKRAVRDHWEAEACGTRAIPDRDRRRFFAEIERRRYSSEPYIAEFAKFDEGRGKRLLEVGIGAGTDYVNWLRHGSNAVGVDLTWKAASLATERARLEGLTPKIVVADAEQLPFAAQTFYLVYSYGVVHHSPDTSQAVAEIHRVLRPGGIARVMVYHVPSVTGFLLWVFHCAAMLRPWRTPRWAIYHFLESPGTKAFTLKEAGQLFAHFAWVRLATRLGTGDLLAMAPSTRYRSLMARAAWRLFPRWLVRRLGDRYGLGLLIEAVK